LEDDTALRVSENGPCDTGILELLYADFAGKGAVGLVEDVLSGYFKTGAEVLAREEEIKGWRGDDNFCDMKGIISLSFPNKKRLSERVPSH
jgi:hypothetical protein